MAAIGMFAPLVESIFHQAFYNMGKFFFEPTPITNGNLRFKCAEDAKWDCHFVWDKSGMKKDLVRGIIQLSQTTGLKPLLPDDIEIVLNILFSYRNKMFHCGFEWPVEERKTFWNRIEKEKWPSHWFSASTSNGVPSIICLTHDFIWHCIDTIHKIIYSLGEFVIETMNKPGIHINFTYLGLITTEENIDS